MGDLTDPDVRAEVTARLGELYAGRPVILGPGVLAGYTPYVAVADLEGLVTLMDERRTGEAVALAAR